MKKKKYRPTMTAGGIEVVQLAIRVREDLERLEQLARTEIAGARSTPSAMAALQAIPEKAINAVLSLIAYAPTLPVGARSVDFPNHPLWGSVAGIIQAIGNFERAVESNPDRFRPAALRRGNWPALADVYSRREDWQSRAQRLELGSMLIAGGKYNHHCLANSRTAWAMSELTWLAFDLKRKGTVAPEWIEAAQLPPLGESTAALRWKKGVQPLMESNRDSWLKSEAFASYHRQAMRNPKDRAKPETRAWNMFISDCRKAYKRLVQSHVKVRRLKKR